MRPSLAIDDIDYIIFFKIHELHGQKELRIYSTSHKMRTSYLPYVGLLAATAAQAVNLTWPVQTYKSSPARPPVLNVTKTGETTPGYLFFDQNGELSPTYSVFIMSEDGELVWQGVEGDLDAYQPQLWHGKPVLTFQNGVSLPEPFGWGYGIIQVFDQTYNNTYNVSITAKEENLVPYGLADPKEIVSYIDMHESKISNKGNMFVTVINTTQADLSSVGGPKDGWIGDSLFYEMDIKTNKIVHSWKSSDHLDQIPFEDVVPFYPVADLGRNSSYPWGYFHINSVDQFKDGSYLVSSRFYCSIFKIAKNGSVEWTLQGRDGGNFTLGSGLSFCYQHDARILEETNDGAVISIFNNDNSAEHHGVNQTTGIIMDVNTKTFKATLKKQFKDPRDPLYSVSQGDLQQIYSNRSDSHYFMGYGSAPIMKEYLPNGTCIMTVQFGPHKNNEIFSYRAFKAPWVGKPTAPPDVFACKNNATSEVDVYMSWNGATEHKTWTVYAGSRNETSALHQVATIGKEGFETKTSVPLNSKFVKVEASGKNIETGKSALVPVHHSC